MLLQALRPTKLMNLLSVVTNAKLIGKKLEMFGLRNRRLLSY